MKYKNTIRNSACVRHLSITTYKAISPNINCTTTHRVEHHRSYGTMISLRQRHTVSAKMLGRYLDASPKTGQMGMLPRAAVAAGKATVRRPNGVHLGLVDSLERFRQCKQQPTSSKTMLWRRPGSHIILELGSNALITIEEIKVSWSTQQVCMPTLPHQKQVASWCCIKWCISTSFTTSDHCEITLRMQCAGTQCQYIQQR